MTSEDKKKQEAPGVTATPPGTTSSKSNEKAGVENLLEQEEARKKRLEEQSKELAILLSQGQKFTSIITGKEIEVPPLNGIAEKKALKIVIDFLKDNSKLFEDIWGDTEKGQGSAILMKILGSADGVMDIGTKIAAILMNKDESWAEENLLMVDIVKIIRPFLLAEVQQISSLVGANMANILKFAMTMKASVPSQSKQG